MLTDMKPQANGLNVQTVEIGFRQHWRQHWNWGCGGTMLYVSTPFEDLVQVEYVAPGGRDSGRLVGDRGERRAPLYG